MLQLDARLTNSEFRVFYNTGRDLSDLNIAEWLRIAQDNSIGEALLTSIEKDGTGKGPDLGLIEFVGKHVKVPVIYRGGNRMWVVLIERSLRQIKCRDREELKGSSKYRL